MVNRGSGVKKRNLINVSAKAEKGKRNKSVGGNMEVLTDRETES